MQTFN